MVFNFIFNLKINITFKLVIFFNSAVFSFILDLNKIYILFKSFKDILVSLILGFIYLGIIFSFILYLIIVLFIIYSYKYSFINTLIYYSFFKLFNSSLLSLYKIIPLVLIYIYTILLNKKIARLLYYINFI